LKVGKASGFGGIPNENLRHLPRRPLVHLTNLYNQCLQLGHIPTFWKEAKFIHNIETRQGPKFPQNLCSIRLLSTTGKLFEKLILRKILNHNEGRNLLNASQFGFLADHSTTLQYVSLADHVTLSFNNNMSMDDVFLDIHKTFCYIICQT
jgi:hypothetical protein